MESRSVIMVGVPGFGTAIPRVVRDLILALGHFFFSTSDGGLILNQVYPPSYT